jgi:hypothetical protein
MAGQLLFYDPTTGQGTFYQYGPDGSLTRLRINSGWRSTWKQIAWGTFADRQYESLLFYDGEGTGEFYLVDPTWYLYPPAKTYSGWVSPAGLPWTHIIGIRKFSGSGSPHSHLLFYDGAGTGAFYRTYGEVEIDLLATHTGWPSAGRPWTHVIEAKFSSSEYTDLLFYDSAGTGVFYTTDGQGGITPVQTYAGWVSPGGIPWTHIIQFNFPFSATRPPFSVLRKYLLFYDSAGRGTFYTIDQEAKINPLRTYTGWVSPAGTPWKQIVPCLDPNPGASGLLFYDGAGTGAFYRYDEQGGIGTALHTDTKLPPGRIIFPFNR